jgi:hypothetical protein
MIPYVVGQWVCGARFFGREAEIAMLLVGRDWRWIAGLRRIGKTSLLRELELRAGRDPECFPLYWDLQGATGDLDASFAEALLDAGAEFEERDLFTSLEALDRDLRARNARLLLLCDEADELAALDREAPGQVAGLWQAIDRFDHARVILASSFRLDARERFGAPLGLEGLTDDDARALLRQSPRLSSLDIETIRETCGNHPMLLQLAGKRTLELGDVAEALRRFETDPTVHHLFAVDSALLAPGETHPSPLFAGWLQRNHPTLIRTSAVPQAPGSAGR